MRAVCVSLLLGIVLGLAILAGLLWLLDTVAPTPITLGTRAAVGCIAHVGGTCQGWVL